MCDMGQDKDKQDVCKEETDYYFNSLDSYYQRTVLAQMCLV